MELFAIKLIFSFKYCHFQMQHAAKAKSIPFSGKIIKKVCKNILGLEALGVMP